MSACIASEVGGRADSWATAVPSRIREVAAPHHAKGVYASEPHDSAVNTASNPHSSAAAINSGASGIGSAPQ